MRRILKISAGILFSLFFLLFLVLSVLQSEAGQKKLRSELTRILSEELQTQVSVGHISWGIVDGVKIKDIYIEDQQGDTLFFVGDLRARIKLIDSDKHFVFLRKISLDQVNVNFRQYSGDTTFNYVFFFDALSTGNTDTSRAPVIWTLLFEKVLLENTRFRMRIDDDTVSGRQFRENDMYFTDIHAELRDFYVVDDSLNFYAKELRLKEHNSVEITHMQANSVICSKGMFFSNLELETPNSSLKDYFSMEYSHWRDFGNFNDDVYMIGRLKGSKVSFVDIRYFSDALLDWGETIEIAGEAVGPLSSMKARGLDIRFGEKSSLTGALTMRGLPNIDETFIDATIDKASGNRDELASLLQMNNLPEELDKLGDFEYSGRFTGFTYDFVAFGDFHTDLGFVSTDINMKLHVPEEYSGTLETVDFDMGTLLDVPEIGKLSLKGSVKGKYFELDSMETEIQASISRLDINNYSYQNMEVNGVLKDLFFEGNLDVKDPNLVMNFDGKVNFKGERPVFDCIADFEKANVAELNWIPNFPARVSGEIVMDFNGSKLDDFLGTIWVRNMEIEKDKQVYPIDSLMLQSVYGSNYRRITLKSDYIDAKLEGDFLPSELGNSFNNYLVQLLPNTVKLERVELKAQDFTFDIDVKNTKEISELISPNIWINSATISGSYNTATSALSMRALVDQLTWGTFEFDQLGVRADSSVGDEPFELQVFCLEVYESDSLVAHGINFDFDVAKENIAFAIQGYSSPYSTEISLNGNLVYTDTSISTVFDPSYILMDTLKWRIADNARLTLVHDSILMIDNFTLAAYDQSVHVNGILFSKDQDKLLVDFKHFDLAVLNPFVFPLGDGSLQGLAEGTIHVQSFEGKLPLFTSDLRIDSLGFNHEVLGNLLLKAQVANKYQIITVNGILQDGPTQRIALSGFISTSKESSGYNLKLEMEETPLYLFQPFMDGLVSDLKGTGKGRLDISGPLNKPELKGKLYLEEAGMRVDYLNTAYHFNTTVTITSNRIDVGRFKIYDEYNNSGYLSGYVTHDFFSDFVLNIELSSLKNFLCLNTGLEHNPDYYGTAYMTGYARFNGPLDNMKIDVKGKTERGSAFFIPLENYGGSSELAFIRFVDFDDYGAELPYQDLSGIQLNFDLEITPSAEIQLIFDSKLGDIIRARGYSHMLMSINSNGDFKMYGEYEIEEGDYLFTAVNLFNKKFEMVRGGKIVWNGDPMKATLNLEAVYHTKASIANLVLGVVREEDMAPYRQLTEVEAIMKLRGALTSPDIRFGFRLPNMASMSSAGVNISTLRTIIRRIETDQEEMTRQVFSLLVANTFIPPAVNQQYAHAGSSVQSGFVSSSVGDLFSNQVSNWLGQINSDWNFGVNYLVGQQQSDFLINASRRFFDDRLQIEGTFATNANFYNYTSAMYTITPDGRLRVRAFNRTGMLQSSDQLGSTTNAINRNINTQGVGLYYSIEFDKLEKDRRAIRKRLKEEKKALQNN